ncbi:hypothetical protein Goklo_012197 [Gossypium klotzschianum]|uniref:UspA domain-containing protein n=1 Tax=Gossypium klotzschianum TaxID=34286 RepID=A0A7J8VBF2_9ROSI|nr:hypothetical protein [Gossypium klotzschianum]
MGRTGARLPGFCLNRIRPHVRVKSPPIQAKPDLDSSKTDQKDEISGKVEEDKSRNGEKTGFLIGRKIMIVVDSSIEAKGALQAPRACEPVSSLQNMSKQKRPEVEVEVAVVEGKEKGLTIVEEAKKQGVALLVLGQKKKSMTWRPVMMWAGSRMTGGVVEYCIQNATCMAVAVRRKSKKLGGYLITTKRHKDFWLLA